MTIKEANDFVEKHHRTHGKVTGAKFAIGLLAQASFEDWQKLLEGQHPEILHRQKWTLPDDFLGAVIVGRPVSKKHDDRWTAEVTRLAVKPEIKNGCSMLLGAARRASKAMGYKWIQTYIMPGLQQEEGVSLKAAGWQPMEYVNPEGRHNKRSRETQVGIVKKLYPDLGPSELVATAIFNPAIKRQRWAVAC